MFTPSERQVLRDLAKRVAEIADLPVQAERRERWKRHNALKRAGPMLLVFPEGSWRELLPQEGLVCQDKQARAMEWTLRSRVYYHEHFADDMPIEKVWTVTASISNTGWGLEPKRIPSTTRLGAWRHDPVLLGPADVKKLRQPEVVYDEKATLAKQALAQDLFGDILRIERKGVAHVSFHFWNRYTDLRGLEQGFADMCEEPELLHEVLGFFQEGYQQMLKQYEELNLLSLNNDYTYHSSGGIGYTDELPAAGFRPERVRFRDMWASAEAQELALVGPEQHEEFSLRYERPLLENFGLNGYGCCEDLTRKLDYVFTIPRIRRISISPFADVDKCAAKLQDRYIFSWKPNPATLVGAFDERRIRKYVRHALDATPGCVLEIVLKDTHTVENEPRRMDRWLQIAREEIERERQARGA